MASNGLLSESRAADALGMPLDQFLRVIKEHEPSRKVWEHALSIERNALLTALYDQAIQGDVKAAQTLLASRHGVSEKQATNGDGDRVNITFALPSAMDPEKYAEALRVERDKPVKGLANES